MNEMQQGIATLLRSAITGEVLPLPEGFDIGMAMDAVKRHGMATLIYEGAVRCGVDKNDAHMKQLFAHYYKALIRSEGQLRQLRRICAAFDENGIDYMPLKGSRMKHLYPKPELRTMGDADILIRMEQYEKIVPIMEELGFSFKHESDHELIWLHEQLFLELHKWVIPSYNKDFYGYFGDGWKLATVKDGTRYSMSPENEYIYLFTHFAKHFRDGGIGCRHVVDLWVYLRRNPALDEAFIRSELEKLHLLEFHDNIRALMGRWFADGPEDEKLELITDFIFDSGSWGELESRIVSQSVKRVKHTLPGFGGRAAFVWKLFFPDPDVMKRDYPILRKHSWLLPVVWVYRIFQKVFFEGKNLKPYEKEMGWMTKDNLDRRKKLLKTVGLDYWF